MTANLNLIPAHYREQFRRRQLFGQLKSTIVALTLYMVVLAIILLVARIILQNRFNTVVNETTLVTKENREVEQLIKTFNRRLDVAEALQKNSSEPWPEFFIALSELTPTDISIQSVRVDAKKQVEITGVAKARASLLSFKDTLTKQPFVSSLQLPLGSLLAKDNVAFTMTFKLDLTEVPTL